MSKITKEAVKQVITFLALISTTLGWMEMSDMITFLSDNVDQIWTAVSTIITFIMAAWTKFDELINKVDQGRKKVGDMALSVMGMKKDK